MSALFRVVLVVLVLLGSAAHAADRLTLGVFAFRPKPIMIERYQPLADYLSDIQNLPTGKLLRGSGLLFGDGSDES